MSNLNTFNQKHLSELLEPFAPGIVEHITPIKYEALTPDCFLFLFRTTDSKGEEHFFVSLETDAGNSLAEVSCTIEEWHGPIIKLWPVLGKEAAKDSEDIDDYKIVTKAPYYAVLAEVNRPTHKGYWADAVKIMPGDKIGEKIKQFSEKEQANIRKTLESILKHKTDPSLPFAEAIKAKNKATIVDDINKTDIAVSVYVQPNGEVECFYNYVNWYEGNVTNE